MTTQHTKGPWEVKELIHSKGFVILHSHAHGKSRVDNGSGEFSKEDARLIAAAPELLGALTTLNIYLPDILKTLSDDFKDHPIFELVKIAEKTIAKANGGKYETIQKD